MMLMHYPKPPISGRTLAEVFCYPPKPRDFLVSIMVDEPQFTLVALIYF